MVDTDFAGTLSAFFKVIKKAKVSIADITYILATHYHTDHIGLVSELVKLGVKLLLVDTQWDCVHFSADIFRRDKHLRYMPIGEKDAAVLSCKDSRKFLNSMGIAGEIILTTSHSSDSISVILDSGECIVGDLEPINYLGAYEGNTALQGDWKCVMSYSPKIIYYAHANEKCFG